MPRWLREYLILPLVVGLIVALFEFALPQFFPDKLELSYEIDDPTRLLDDPAISHVQVEVNGTAVSHLAMFRVRLWNSGNRAIKDLPVRLTFDDDSGHFAILNITHQTTHRYEFGKIDELEVTPLSRRYRYELLNPGDQDVITLLTTGTPELELHAKGEDVKVIRREQVNLVSAGLRRGVLHVSVNMYVLPAVGALLSIAYIRWRDKRELIERVKRPQ